MARSVLLTLGRLPKGLELARCLHRAGCTGYVADPFGTHLSKLSNAVKKSFKVAAPNRNEPQFRRDILHIIEEYKIDMLAPVSEEALFVAALADALPEHVELVSAPFEDLNRVHDKLEFIGIVHKAGLNAPETWRANTKGAASLIDRSETVFKPILGCSGAGLAFLPEAGDLPNGFPHEDAIVQQRIRGQEISSLSYARNGEVLASVLYKGLVYAGTVSTCFERLDDQKRAEDWIRRFVAHENWSGFIAFDFIVDADGVPWPIECNPRLTSGLHFFEHEALGKALLGEQLETPVGYNPQQRFQEGHTCLTKAYEDFLRPLKFIRRLGLLFSTRDVLWSSKDPLPFLTMTPMSWPILSQVIFKGASFGEAATRDIEWLPVNGGEGTPRLRHTSGA